MPFDVISQHAMVLGMKSVQPNANGNVLVSELNPLGIEYHKNRSRMKISLDIATAIYRTDGLRGYYRGYVASLMAYVPNSALWWTFYHLYQGDRGAANTLPFQYTAEVAIFINLTLSVTFSSAHPTEHLLNVLPSNASHLLIQCVSGSLGGFTTTIITNPLDIVRARLQVLLIEWNIAYFMIVQYREFYSFWFCSVFVCAQVQRLDSLSLAFRELWSEEKMNMFFKGLSARLVQSAMFSFSIILGYETIKRISVNDQYKHRVRW